MVKMPYGSKHLLRRYLTPPPKKKQALPKKVLGSIGIIMNHYPPSSTIVNLLAIHEPLLEHNYGTSQSLKLRKSTISMAILNSYVS